MEDKKKEYAGLIGACYDEYAETVRKAVASASIADGLLGFGTSVGKLPVHEEFFESVSRLVDEMAEKSPEAGEAAGVVRFIMEASSRYPQKETFWACIACEGLAVKLVGFLTPEDSASLLELYKRTAPPLRRFPVQKELAKALKQQAAGFTPRR